MQELAGQEYAGMEAKIERMEQANWLAYEKEAQERARAAEAARWAGTAKIEQEMWRNLTPLDYLKTVVGVKDISTSLYMTINATRAMLGRYPNIPSIDEKARMEFERLNIDAEFKITPSEYINRHNYLLDTTFTPKWDAVDTGNMKGINNGLRTSLINAPALTSFALSQAGNLFENSDTTLSTNLKGSGGILGGLTDVVDGLTTLTNKNLTTELIKPGFWGRGITALHIPFGVWQYGVSATRLVNDPSLIPGTENSEDVWLKRVGVAAQGIGAAMITGGAVIATALAFSVVLAPAAPAVAGILIGAGVLISGAGAIMENWNWVKEAKRNIINS
jgi:hypothetical protein